MSDERAYLFDLYNNRPLIADGDGEVDLGRQRLAALLEHLAKSGRSGVLRAFAAATARDLLGNTRDPHQRALVATAEAGAATPEDPAVQAEMARVRSEAGHVAVAAGAIGLRHRAANAASFLAAYAACHADARTAASEAVRMAHLYGELARDGASPEVIAEQHVNRLLDLMGT